MSIRRASRVVGALALLAPVLVLPAANAADARRAAPTPSADYQFQGKLTGCGGIKALTAYKGTKYATQTVDGKARKVLTFPADSGVYLSPTTSIMPSTTYTVVALFKFQTISSWRMIMDVKGLVGDDAFYVYSGTLQWYPLAMSTTTPFKVNTWEQVAIVVAKKHITAYVNGKKVYDVADTSGYSTVSSKNKASFFKDNVGGGPEQSAGSVARLRFYKTALSASAVAALDRAPTTACK